MAPPAVILDVDGTLVDSNYQHTMAWNGALRQHGLHLPLWRIHRAIGMGGDQLVPALCGETVEREHGDDIRAAETALFRERMGEVRPFDDATAFVRFLVAEGRPVVLSSSAKEAEVEHYLDLLGVRAEVAGWTTADDVRRTKPEPDVIQAGLAKLEKEDVEGAVMVGDSVYDVIAAGRAGLPTVGLLTGGFGAGELREVGATDVFASLSELRAAAGKTPLSG